MANSDGQVKIEVITNAKKVLKDMNSVNKVFDENVGAMKNATSATSAYEQVVQNNIKVLREAALGGNQNTEAFKKLSEETKKYQQALNQANTEVNKALGINNQQNNSVSKLMGAVKGLAGAYLGIQGIRMFINYSKEAMEAFRTQEVAILQLNQTLKNAGVYSYEYSQSIQKLASEIQSYSNYGDEAIIKAQALGQAYIGNTKITKDLTKAVVDFAAATGMDLEQAFSLVGKSIGSQTNALARYGIQLEKGMSDVQKMDAIQSQLAQRFDGTAKQMANTSTQLKNALGDLAEEFGNVLNPTVNKTQKVLIDGAQKLTYWIRQVRILKREINNLTLDDLNERLKVVSNYMAELESGTFDKSGVKANTSTKGVYGDLARKYAKEQQDIIAQIRKLKQQEKQLETISQQKGFKINDDIMGVSSNVGGSSSVQKMKDDYEKLQEAVSKAKREIELAALAHGTSSVQVQNAFTNYRNLNQQLQAINELFKEEKQQISETTTLFDVDSKSIEQNLRSISSSLSSGLVSALTNGGNAFATFSNLAVNALQMVLDKVLEMAVITPILNSISSGVGGSFFGSLFGSKDGNVFQNGNVVPFAKGGVVNQPTLFPMANGGTGLMGEAGAEAVMPLRRMSNGRLGVEAENKGNGQVVNIYNYSGDNVETRKRDDNTMDVFIRRVNEALSNERTSSGFRAAYQREDRKGVQAV